jgi:hypothetical protein
MKKHAGVFFSAMFLLLGILRGNADSVFVNDGRIFLGKIVSASGGTVALEAYGRKVELPASDILRTETDLKSLAHTKVEVVLKDSSVIRGVIVNFDSDIGLFLDIGFGILTLPVASIRDVYDPATREAYEGPPSTIFAGGTFNQPFGTADFGGGYSGEVLGEWKTPWLRGLYLGIGLEYNALNYTAVSQLQYSLVNLSFDATYKYLGFKSSHGPLSFLVPYATVGLGPSIILVTDNRAGIYPNQYGSLVSHVRFDAGLEFGAWQDVSLRLFGDSTLIFQSGSPFTTLGAGLLIGYSF